MRAFLKRLLPRQTRSGYEWGRGRSLMWEYRRRWHVPLSGADLSFSYVGAGIRWPISLHVCLSNNHYNTGGYLARHKDPCAPGERRIQIQFVVESAKEGGELVSEHFFLNWKRFKVFDPCAYVHEVTPVTEGRRRVLNFGIRWSWRPLKHSPF